MEQFSGEDYENAARRGIAKEALDQQWNWLQKGFPRVSLLKPASIDDGIIRLNTSEKERFQNFFRSEVSHYKSCKFVPASGAASRMFQPFRDVLKDTSSKHSQALLAKLKDLPFYDDIIQSMESKSLSSKDPIEVIRYAMDKQGMDFNHLPKGLVSFFRKDDKGKNAFQAHCDEANALGIEKVHFTVAEEYKSAIASSVENENVALSIQLPETDFIAKENDRAFRIDGQLIFRPSGHGALLTNLNTIDAELFFIKNIDNIQDKGNNKISIDVKEQLGGMALQLKQEIDAMLLILDQDENADLKEMEKWIQDHLDSHFSSESKTVIFDYLNRPLRIAGMVINEGQPGGGPYWVENQFGQNLQIIEAAQIDRTNPDQEAILQASSHFNPVELVCMIKDYQGKTFELQDYVDKDAGFLSPKTIADRSVTIMERPGLWNGSMANWITLFVETPIESFTPVKSIEDLIRN